MTAGHSSNSIPLIDRPQDAVLFRRPDAALTAARFLRDVHRVAADLPDAGHVCNLCEDRYAFAVAFAAAALRGQVSLLSSDRSRATLEGLRARFHQVVSVSDTPSSRSPLRHHVMALHQDAVVGAVANPLLPVDRLIAIVFTSGTTGIPTGFRKTWGALTHRSRDAGRRFLATTVEPAGLVGTVPPQHMYGFETTVLLPLHTLAASWSGPAFYPLDIRDALRRVPAPRILVTTPLQIRTLLDSAISLPALDAVISATAPLDPDLAAAAERQWTTRVLEIFGATEVGSIASRRTVDGPTWTTYEQIRLAAGEQPDQAVVTAPHAEPHPLADLVEQLSPTEFKLLGRAADMIKLGGRRASLSGLNAILASVPGVTDGVFVVPDDLDRRPSARLLAFVVAPDTSPEAILARLRTQIEPVFLPRRVVQVSALPRNATGKLPRGALLDLLAQNEATR